MKEKTFFKILTISLSIVLILMGLNLNAYASITDTTNTGTIKVSGIEAGLTVTAYQLTSVNYDYTANQPQAVPYTWEAGVKTWLQTNYADKGYADPEKFYKGMTDADAAKAFYSKLAAAIKGNQVTIADENIKTQTTTGTASYPVTSEKLNSSVTFTDCAMGTYLILIENGYRVYSPSAVNLTPEFNTTTKEWNLNNEVEVEVKSTTPTVTKTVNGETADNYSTKDTMNFKIVADVPTYEANSLANKYMISDKVSGGLVIDETSIKVSGQSGSADPVALTATTDYTLTTGATRKNTSAVEAEKSVDFLVEFVYSKLKGKYNKVIVEYTATLAKGDTTKFGSTNKNENTAFLDYSNNPYVESSYQEQKSTNTIYTYGIELTKVDKNNTSVALPGAEFELKSGSNALYFAKTADGVYYQTADTDESKTTKLVVDASGKLNIKGLDVGTYSLVETKAPEGYNKATEAKTIEIADANMDGAIDDATTPITSGIFSLTFPNGQGFQLPITGGMGTTVFAACGIVVFGIGIMLLVAAVKKNKSNK